MVSLLIVYILLCSTNHTSSQYMPYASLALVSITLGAIYHQHSQYSIPLYKAHMRPILILHIVSGLTELLGLYIRPLLHTHDKIPDSIDLTLCLAQSGTNMALVKRMARGQWKMTRPSYQAGALLRPVLTILGMIYQRSDLHTSSLQILHAFIYTRYLIYLWSKTGLLDKHSDIYMMAVFCAAILAMMDTPFPAVLSKAYILCVAGISLLNHWTSQQLEEDTSRHSKIKIDLLNLLVFLGLADLPTLKGGEPSDMVKDDYCGDLGIEEAGDESLPDARKYLCDSEHDVVD